MSISGTVPAKLCLDTKIPILMEKKMNPFNELKKVKTLLVDDDDFIRKSIEEGDLPPLPDASIENYRIKTIFRKDTEDVVGFFDFYCGYPSANCIWMGIFLIDKKHRKNGYAQEVINFIAEEGKKAGYEK